MADVTITLDDQSTWMLLAGVAGLIADLLLRLLKPSAERPVALLIFAFAVPAIPFLGGEIHEGSPLVRA